MGPGAGLVEVLHSGRMLELTVGLDWAEGLSPFPWREWVEPAEQLLDHQRGAALILYPSGLPFHTLGQSYR